MYLKEQSAVGLQTDALPIWQCQKLVIIHDAVHVFHPYSIHVSIEHQVLGLILQKSKRQSVGFHDSFTCSSSDNHKGTHEPSSSSVYFVMSKLS